MNSKTLKVGIDIGSGSIKYVVVSNDNIIKDTGVRTIDARPLLVICDLLELINNQHRGSDFLLGITGSGTENINELLDGTYTKETEAITRAINLLYPDTRTVIQMGKESQMYFELIRGKQHRLLVNKCNLGNRCAAGCGSFIEHMTKRLKFESLDHFVASALIAESPATIAGRCAVFAESDITHLYQKGTGKDRIASGICQAIARNFQGLVKNGEIEDEVIFIGGVSKNKAVKKFLEKELGIKKLIVPKFNLYLGAIGAAHGADKKLDISKTIIRIKSEISKPVSYEAVNPIKLEFSSTFDNIFTDLPVPKTIEKAYLGLDIGSVSTKAALLIEIDEKLQLISHFYRRTDGDPLVAVIDTISKIKNDLDTQNIVIKNIIASTTGSGRYLTADFIGAYAVDEITAQANGALFYNKNANIVLEIGGQDSKIIYLKNGNMIDYAMNKACAAGCGAFLEAMAEILNIKLTEFGERALLNISPPAINWTCTVFTKSSIMKLLLEGVNTNDLASAVCMASVHNYLAKNVGNRMIDGDIVFQGAVAFNRGMIAAVESILGKKITVPKFPHITGAIGAARFIHQNHEKAPVFKGFDKIKKAKYRIKSFECKSCPNNCDVNVFNVDSENYFYNDRCEKYSGKDKKGSSNEFPNLFNEYSNILMDSVDLNKNDRTKTIGIPRGLMFNEYYPLYGKFFTELGFRVVPSSPTNKSLIKKALNISLEEPCFPFKVHFGHVNELIENKTNYFFLPTIISTENDNDNFEFSKTCPYLQGAAKMVASTFKIPPGRTISPVIYFHRGRKHLEKVFTDIAKRLKKSKSEALKALDKGLENLNEFRNKILVRGKEILDGIKPDQEIWIVTGRPYTLFDQALNMNIGNKIQNIGILAVPSCFLDLTEVGISEYWSGIYSRQIQIKLQVANSVKYKLNFKIVNLSYFGCGPDAFGNPFTEREYNRPALELQLDEHTSDTGLITRIEAFHNTKEEKTFPKPNIYRDGINDFTKLQNKILWVPYANEGAKLLVASLRAYDIDARILPRSPNMSLELARKKIYTDVCLPMFVTTEDMLYRATKNDFDPENEWFFQGNSNGPCRYGMYDLYQKIILKETGIGDSKVVSLGTVSQHGKMGLMFAKLAFDTMLAHDMLERMYGRTRPYEKYPGESQKVFDKYLLNLIEITPDHKNVLETNKLKVILGIKHHGILQSLIREAAKDFQNIEKTGCKKPIVGVVGEFFVRINEFSNQNIISKLESYGLETWLAPMTEFFSYSMHISKLLAWESLFSGEFNLKSIFKWLKFSLNDRLSQQSEHEICSAANSYLKNYIDIGPEELIRLGSHYVFPDYGGEPICTMGKMEDFAWRNLSGIITLMPMNCIPGITVLTMSQGFGNENKIPVLNLDYDGFPSTIKREQEIQIFAQLVNDHHTN
jgi:predicted CoA-substrate-specific enzyme activase